MLGQLERAEAGYEQACRRAEDHQLDELAAWAYFEYGDLKRQSGDIEGALNALDRSEQLAEDLEHGAVHRAVLANQACCHVDLVDPGRARDALRQVDELAETGDLRTEAHLSRRVAYVHYYLEEIVEQQRLNRRALRLADQLDDRRLQGICAQGLADSLLFGGEYDEAISVYRDALQTHRELGNEHHEGILLGNLGGALHRCDAFVEAADSYHRSLEIHRHTGATPYLAVVTSALGVLDHERSQLTQARAHYKRARRLFDRLGHLPDTGSALLYRGWLALEMGQTQRAEQYLAEVRASFSAVTKTNTAGKAWPLREGEVSPLWWTVYNLAPKRLGTNRSWHVRLTAYPAYAQASRRACGQKARRTADAG